MDYNSKPYCSSLTEYHRYKTREVCIGDIPLGASNPIRIQSMTTTNTMDTIATVEQTIRMVNAGCEYVRITVPGLNDAQNLPRIKKELRSRGCSVPIIADIHFTPNVAEFAARVVEKIRINPGNYVDKKKFLQIEYTEGEYQSELERVATRFLPLVKICKEYGTAMRIGTNHGSLSDRIMSRYGDSPLGMVESALEFVRVCHQAGYHNIVLSMKASNPQVMVQAYRLLVRQMEQENMNYPLHLGVTEAGDGQDGRVKSAVGIGALLEDGLGDTIRVSLTEEPERELPIALMLASRYSTRVAHTPIPEVITPRFDPYNYNKRTTSEIMGIGGTNFPRVFADFSSGINVPEELETVGCFYHAETDKWTLTNSACDFIYLKDSDISFGLPGSLKLVYSSDKWASLADKEKGFPVFASLDEFISVADKSGILNFVTLTINDLSRLAERTQYENVVFVLETSNIHGMAEERRVMLELTDRQIDNPVILKRTYNNISLEKFMIYSSTDFGALLLDGFGDGLWMSAKPFATLDRYESVRAVNLILFGILQATRLRISKTEYIACPSCGRTLFDLQQVTAKIRNRTENLQGVKIGIMGCIVNGPGEMADADYGYVGSGAGKITLYRGKKIVRRNISSELAVDALIELIKEDDRWIEPTDY
ncbi:MAG: (E)-4-hydroxy-3-methylbut-2-enyl-diphosphate synthase [Ignavibacteria bacterium]